MYVTSCYNMGGREAFVVHVTELIWYSDLPRSQNNYYADLFIASKTLLHEPELDRVTLRDRDMFDFFCLEKWRFDTWIAHCSTNY